MNAATPRTTLRVRVTAAAERAVRSRHPWVYDESIREQNRPGQLGELAVIYDRQNKFLALGLFDPESPLRIRILHVGKPQNLDAAWWRARWEQARTRRAGLFDAQTTGGRLIHGESDGWPGLVLDQYGAHRVLKLYTAAWLPRLTEIQTLLASDLPAEGALVLRLSRNIQALAREQFQLTDGQMLAGQVSGPITFLESGLRLEADLVRGQKTGFFLDQRENRRQVETLARERTVLNAFSFSGGFSLYAARGGARSVLDLDISEHALAAARRNFALNQDHPAITACRHETAQADAFEWLAQTADRKFDLVILDPPSLAKRQSERDGALSAYGQLAGHGIRWLAPDGILLAASCSAQVPAEEFFNVVRETARQSGRSFEELFTTGHPFDHPATFPEARYLKAIYLRIGR